MWGALAPRSLDTPRQRERAPQPPVKGLKPTYQVKGGIAGATGAICPFMQAEKQRCVLFQDLVFLGCKRRNEEMMSSVTWRIWRCRTT